MNKNYVPTGFSTLAAHFAVHARIGQPFKPYTIPNLDFFIQRMLANGYDVSDALPTK
jgi:hypothetical protein